MLSPNTWSWLLFVVCIVGFWVAGRWPRAGWAFLLCVQPLYLAAAVDIGQDGGVVTTIFLTIVYVRNLRWARRQGKPRAADCRCECTCAASADTPTDTVSRQRRRVAVGSESPATQPAQAPSPAHV